MERATGKSVMSVRSERAFESSSFVFSRRKTPEQTVRIYCVGELGLDERLVRLPDLVLDEDCQVVKLEKKISVFRLPLRIGRAIKFVYVKQHNALSFWHRLTSLFCASAALRSLSGAAALLREGYATARPIAAVEYRRRGVLIKSFYVSEEIAGAKTIADYWREDLFPIKGRRDNWCEAYSRKRTTRSQKGCDGSSKQTSIHTLKRLVDPLAGLSISVKIVGCFKMTKALGFFRRLTLTLALTFGLSGLCEAHSGMVDGYGCHRAPDKVSYHCHQGQFAGRTFKSKEDFLRQLRGGKSEQLSPKSNPPQLEKKIDK